MGHARPYADQLKAEFIQMAYGSAMLWVNIAPAMARLNEFVISIATYADLQNI